MMNLIPTNLVEQTMFSFFDTISTTQSEGMDKYLSWKESDVEKIGIVGYEMNQEPPQGIDHDNWYVNGSIEEGFLSLPCGNGDEGETMEIIIELSNGECIDHTLSNYQTIGEIFDEILEWIEVENPKDGKMVKYQSMM